MLRSVYSIYLEHVQREVEELSAKRGFSLTWAAKETAYLLMPVFRGGSSPYTQANPTSREILLDAARHVPLILVERDGSRECVSIADLAEEPRFWTVESPLVASAEHLIQEVPGTTSLSTLMSALAVAGQELPGDPIVCTLGESNPLLSQLFEGVEVAAVHVYSEERRVDLGWECKADPPRWRDLSHEIVILWDYWRRDPFSSSGSLSEAAERAARVRLACGVIDELVVPSENLVLRTATHTYVVDTSLAEYLGDYLDQAHAANDEGPREVAMRLLSFVARVAAAPELHDSTSQVLHELFTKSHPELQRAFDCGEFCELLASTEMLTFDPSAWRRTT